MLLFICFIVAISHALVLSVSDAPSLLTTLASAADGDIIELSAGEYALPASSSGILLSLTRPITLRTAPSDAPARAVLRAASADETDVLIGIGSSDVWLENLVFARPASGAARNIDRTVDVLISAGTQQQPSVLAIGAYGGVQAANRKRRAPMGAVHAARNIGKSKRSIDTATRGLVNITLRELDFTASYSHSELVFDSGAYIGVVVERCSFGSATTSNAIVTLGGSHFDAATSLVSMSAFAGSPLVLNGDGLTVGTNYWSTGSRSQQSTYCLDAECTTFGPVTDGLSAYATIAAALTAGAGLVRVTAATALLAADGECAVVWREATVFEGIAVQDCANANVATVTVGAHGACPAALVVVEGALAGMSNLRFELSSDVHAAVAIVSTYGTYNALPGEQQVLFDNVTFIGEQTATAIVHQGSVTRLTLHESTFIGVGTAVDLRAGDLAVADSAFVANEAGAITVSTLTTPDTRGLRVSGAAFVGSSKGSIVVGVPSSKLHEFYVACNRFIFAPFVAPTDCAASGATCQNAIRHNTMIDEPALLSAEARRVLVRGQNHIADAPPSALAQYAQFRRTAATHQQFDLVDAQGRLNTVTATVNTPASWQYMLATYAPMRAECFAGALPTSTDPLAPARVVSNLFELRSDAPSQCISIALRATLADANATQHDGEDVEFYTIAHLGDQGSGQWQRAAVHSVLTIDDGTSVTIEASSGSGQLTRAVAVAVHASPQEAAASLATGVVAVRAATRRLCVACGTDKLPAYVVDSRCGGNTEQNVYDDFDAAMAAARRANALKSSVSLLVYGSQCVASQCTYELPGGTAFTLEGLGVLARGTLRRAPTCTSSFLVASAASITVRNLIMPDRSTCVLSAPTNERASGPLLAFLTLAGSVCVDARFDVSLVGNELSAGAVFNGTSVARIEQNTFSGSLMLNRVAQADVRNNTFVAGLAVASESAVAYFANQFASSQASCKSTTEVECTSKSTSAFCACLVPRAVVVSADAAAAAVLPAISIAACTLECTPVNELVPTIAGCQTTAGSTLCNIVQQGPACGVCLAFNTSVSFCEMPLDVNGQRPLCSSSQCGPGSFNTPCQCDAVCACQYLELGSAFQVVGYALCATGLPPPEPAPDAECQISCEPTNNFQVSACSAVSSTELCNAAGVSPVNTSLCGICVATIGAGSGLKCQLPRNIFGAFTTCDSPICQTVADEGKPCDCGGGATCACFYTNESGSQPFGYQLCVAPEPSPTPPTPTCNAECLVPAGSTPLSTHCAPLGSDTICGTLNLTNTCGECIVAGDGSGLCQLPQDIFGVRQNCQSAQCLGASTEGIECFCVACGCLYETDETPGIGAYTLCDEASPDAPTCVGTCGANTSAPCVTLNGTDIIGVCNSKLLCEFINAEQIPDAALQKNVTCTPNIPCAFGEPCTCVSTFSGCFCPDAVLVEGIPFSVPCLSEEFPTCGGQCTFDNSSNCVERTGASIRGVCDEASGFACTFNGEFQGAVQAQTCISDVACTAIGQQCTCSIKDETAVGCFCTVPAFQNGTIIDQVCSVAPEPPCEALCPVTADGNCSTKTGAEILGFCVSPKACFFFGDNATVVECKSSSPCDVVGEECFCDLETTLTGCFCNQPLDLKPDGLGVSDTLCSTAPQVTPPIEPVCTGPCPTINGTVNSGCQSTSSATLCELAGQPFAMCGVCVPVNGSSACELGITSITNTTQICSASAQCSSAADVGRQCFCADTCACVYASGTGDNIKFAGFQLCEEPGVAPSSNNTGLFIFLGVFLGLLLLILIAIGLGGAMYYATTSRTPSLPPPPPPFVSPTGAPMRMQPLQYESAPVAGTVSGFNLEAVGQQLRRRKNE
jgi:hypothetical protein